MIEYGGYQAMVKYDDAGFFHGEVIDTRDVITFQGTSVAELHRAFKDSVDEYLNVCAERGRNPDKPYSGKVALRLTPALHRAATAAAQAANKSLNAWLAETVERATRMS